MPTINIPPVVRFVLYLLGSIALLTVSYAVDKSWAGDAEVRYVTGLAGLLFILAAAKTGVSDNSASVTGTVVSESGETGEIIATIGAPDSVQKPQRSGPTYVARNGDPHFVSDPAGPPLTDAEKRAAGFADPAEGDPHR